MTPEIYIILIIVLSLASAVLVRIQARAAYALGYAEGRRDAWVKAASEAEHAQKDALRSARQPHIRRLAAIEAEKAEEELKLKRAERERADTLNEQLKRELGLTRKGQ
jgi:biopolymer transport protein ExbB/TolQ